MKWRCNDKGVALLMTLAFITLAISLAVETNRQSRFAIEGTDAVQNRIRAGQMATAGVHGAMALLIQDRYTSETDHLKETWAEPEELAQAIDSVSFADGRLEVSITDEMARIQVNALVDFPQSRQFNPQQQQIMERLIDLTRKKIDVQNDGSATDIVNALKDWLDTGDDDAITGLNGAESDHYQALDPPYTSRNGPMRHIDELARIKGVSKALYGGDDEIQGLKEHLTVYGAAKTARGEFSFSGRVNLNTASLPVIAALLPPEYSDLAEAIIRYRDEAEAVVLEGRNWYQEIPGAAGLELAADAITLSTNIFRVRATAISGTIQRVVSAVVERQIAADGEGWTCRILSWEIS